jgi:hypothetical protein
MLIATSAVTLLVASSLAAGAFAPITPAPPIVVNVSAAPNVPSSIVANTIAEADAIFRRAGMPFIWRVGASALATVTVAIVNESRSPVKAGTPLGWIEFMDGRPDSNIYLSYASAEKYLFESRSVVGLAMNMTRAERELFVGRALGRALAHELGHYLLATKEHTAKGLLKAVRSASEFFLVDRGRFFELEPAQRMQITERLRGDAIVASRQQLGGTRRARGSSE